MRKNAKQFIELECCGCGKVITRSLSEHKRNQALNRKVFCSLSCKGKHLPAPMGFSGDLSRFGDKVGRPKDELTPFRGYVSRARQRKQHEHTITPEYLKSLWDAQGGTCPYLKIAMKLPKNSNDCHDSLKYASLDRIDSAKGYIEGNVEFVSMFANYAKNKFSKEQVLEILNEFKLS